MSKPRIAFFGLGLMGSGMARRLLGAGFPLTVFNRSRDKADALAKEGAHAAGSPREAAAQADFLISMVADDNASRAMWLGEQGALAGATRGALLIEASTLTVAWVKELAAAAEARGCELLDAPVTGSKVHAAAGELSFLVGGSAAALEKARPVLAVMSKGVRHVGPGGCGALLKLINNFMCGVQVASLAEALALIERSDLDRAAALEVIGNGTPGSPLVKIVLPRMTARDYTPNFALPLMAKDLAYSLSEAERRGVPLATVAAALDIFQQAISDGHAEQDFSVIAETLRNSPPP
jgi:3-hydroxyisobutyrate dehydrogenase